MRTSLLAIIGLCFLLINLAGCNSTESQNPSEMPGAIKSEIPKINPAALFIDTDSVGPVDNTPQITRSRFAKLNLALLVDPNGEAVKPDLAAEITLNLFPDVTYTGVIKQIQEDGGSITWVGYLKDVEYSELTMVFTGGVFIAHFASPMGVYEVSNVGDGLYRIILIDQTKLPGGEGNIEG